MSADTINAIAGILLAMVFEYFPVLNEKFNALPDNQQRLVVIGACVLVALGSFGLACAGFLNKLDPNAQLTCDEAGVLALVKSFVSILIASQATYNVLLKSDKG